MSGVSNDRILGFQLTPAAVKVVELEDLVAELRSALQEAEEYAQAGWAEAKRYATEVAKLRRYVAVVASGMPRGDLLAVERALADLEESAS